jgi:hypothetical protein
LETSAHLGERQRLEIVKAVFFAECFTRNFDVFLLKKTILMGFFNNRSATLSSVLQIDVFYLPWHDVQRMSKFCFVVVVLGVDTLIKILHYCPISPCFQD